MYTTLLLCCAVLQEDKDHLHYYVSAAQRALLNPDTPADVFVRGADNEASLARSNNNGSFEDVTAKQILSNVEGHTEDVLQFTRNVVVLEITGADVDLALIDLPGIIQAEKSDGGSNVKLLKSLVEHYISSDRAIIVATITCKDDIDNQVCPAALSAPSACHAVHALALSEIELLTSG